MPVYTLPVLLVYHCTYSRRDGQAELAYTEMVTRPQTLTHPSTNRAGRTATTLIDTIALLLNLYTARSAQRSPSIAIYQIIVRCAALHRNIIANNYNRSHIQAEFS